MKTPSTPTDRQPTSSDVALVVVEDVGPSGRVGSLLGLAEVVDLSTDGSPPKDDEVSFYSYSPMPEPPNVPEAGWYCAIV